jgi:hypothetical protein
VAPVNRAVRFELTVCDDEGFRVRKFTSPFLELTPGQVDRLSEAIESQVTMFLELAQGVLEAQRATHVD